MWNRVRLSLRGKKLIINQTLLSKLWYIGQTYTIPKYIKKQIEKMIFDFLWEGKKIRPPRHLVQLPIWKGRLGILDIDTQLNSLKNKWIQRLLNSNNALRKNLMLYQLNLNLKSNQGLALFRLNQILQSTRHSNLQNNNNEDFFIQMLNAWLHFTNNTFPPPTSIEEILDQPLFLNPHTKLPYNSDNPYFYCLPPQNISDKFATIRDICRFLQLALIPSVSFGEKLNLPNVNHNKIYKSIIELIPNNWIQMLKTETSQQSLLKVFCFNYKGTKKVKNFQKLSNKEINNNNENFNRPFKFISWTNHIDENPVLNPKNWGKIFPNWSKKCSDGYIFSTEYKLIHFSLPLSPAIHRMGNTPTNRCPRCKESEESHPHFIFHCKLSQTTLNFINRLINQNYKFQSPFQIGITDILMGLSYKTYEDVRLEILPILIEVFLRHLSFYRRKAFYEDGYNTPTKLMNLTTIKEILFQDLKPSKIKQWN